MAAFRPAPPTTLPGGGGGMEVERHGQSTRGAVCAGEVAGARRQGAGEARGAAAPGLLGDDGNPQPLVHRDISPENVLLGRWGDVRVVDFGLARTSAMDDQLTQVGIIKGKVSYMAPEMLEGGAVSPAWDIFALG